MKKLLLGAILLAGCAGSQSTPNVQYNTSALIHEYMGMECRTRYENLVEMSEEDRQKFIEKLRIQEQQLLSDPEHYIIKYRTCFGTDKTLSGADLELEILRSQIQELETAPTVKEFKDFKKAWGELSKD